MNHLITKLLDLYRADPVLLVTKKITRCIGKLHCTKNWIMQIYICSIHASIRYNLILSEPHRILGILFYTDTHYGDSLIDFNEEQLDVIKRCTKCSCFDRIENYMRLDQHTSSVHKITQSLKVLTKCGNCKLIS